MERSCYVGNNNNNNPNELLPESIDGFKMSECIIWQKHRCAVRSDVLTIQHFMWEFNEMIKENVTTSTECDNRTNANLLRRYHVPALFSILWICAQCTDRNHEKGHQSGVYLTDRNRQISRQTSNCIAIDDK